MRLLLDTHVFIWFLSKQSVLPAETRAKIIDPENIKFLSIASVWEMSIKAGLGKLNLAFSTKDLVAEFQKYSGLILPVSLEHSLAVENLPWHHKDPFDRMLITQALCDDLLLVSHDAQFAQYPVQILYQ